VEQLCAAKQRLEAAVEFFEKMHSVLLMSDVEFVSCFTTNCSDPLAVALCPTRWRDNHRGTSFYYRKRQQDKVSKKKPSRLGLHDASQI